MYFCLIIIDRKKSPKLSSPVKHTNYRISKPISHRNEIMIVLLHRKLININQNPFCFVYFDTDLLLFQIFEIKVFNYASNFN